MAKSSVEYVYGINPCFEVVRGGRRKIYGAFLSTTSKNNPRMKKLVSFLESRSIRVEWVDKNRLFQLSKSKEHQGAVIKTGLYNYSSFEALLTEPRLLLLDNVEDPHNVGAIIRSAEIFGFNSVLLPVKGVPEVYPSVVKVSTGASEHLNIARETSSIGYFKKAKEAGYTVIALDGGGDHDLEELNAADYEKIMLVIGGEGKAVGQYILNNADYVASIRQMGQINSLNASVAAGIAMFALGGR